MYRLYIIDKLKMLYKYLVTKGSSFLNRWRYLHL